MAPRFEKMCQLGGGGCFASSVDADDQNDFWMCGEGTNGWGIDWKNTTNFVSRHFADVIGGDPAARITFLELLHYAQRHGHSDVRANQRLFQLVPIDRFAGKLVDDVLEKSHSADLVIPSESRGIPVRKV